MIEKQHKCQIYEFKMAAMRQIDITVNILKHYTYAIFITLFTQYTIKAYIIYHTLVGMN